MGPPINLPSQPRLVLILQLSEGVRGALERGVLDDLCASPHVLGHSQALPPLWQEAKACLNEGQLGHAGGSASRTQ